MSIIFRSEGALYRFTSCVLRATNSSIGENKKELPKAIPPNVDFLKKERRLFSCSLYIFLLIQPLKKIFFYFISPLLIDLARRIFSFAQALMSKRVPQLNEFSVLHQVFDQGGWNEDGTCFFRQYYIAR